MSLGQFFHLFSRVWAARLAYFWLELQMVLGPRGVGWEGHKHAADVGTLGSCAYGWGLGCGLWGLVMTATLTRTRTRTFFIGTAGGRPGLRLARSLASY